MPHTPPPAADPGPDPEPDAHPRSLLDNDLYKFTMQQAVLHHYPHVRVAYALINRDPRMRFNAEAFRWLEGKIQALSTLRLTQAEHAYLTTHHFFTPDYLTYLLSFRFSPSDHITLTFSPDTGHLDLTIRGFWLETILYEVPLLALVSEAYFRHVDTRWSYASQRENAMAKTWRLVEEGCRFSDFGTRRRRDYKTQEIVVGAFVEAEREWKERGGVGDGGFMGTSNVHFAMKFGCGVVGTVAHEFIMAVSALTSPTRANRTTLTLWLAEFHGALSIALTDTFGTAAFLRDFDATLAQTFAGVRHDSGDPIEFAERIVKHYRAVGVDPTQKIVVFSDALDVERAVQIRRVCERIGVGCAFGIGTFLTNDFKSLCEGSEAGERSMPMVIVIKMTECEGRPVVKLSDDVEKRGGDPAEVNRILEVMRIEMGDGDGEEEV